MHVNRAEDRGGNDIQVRYDGQGTNLHALWDSKLSEYEGLAFNQLAINDDTATPGEIRQWQNDDMLKWLYESYKISNQLYTESDNSKFIDDRYYSTYLPVIQ